ncbi:MAG: ROK family protein [Nitriliruptorales bacterium]
MRGSTADRSLVRGINRSVVLRTVKEAGALSRADLARASGLSQVTIGSIVSELIDRQLLVEGDEAPSNGGRPSRLLLLNGGAYVAAGLKVTEDHVVGALTDLEATVLAEATRPLATAEPENAAAAVGELIGDLLTESGVTASRLLGVGIGMAGVIDGPSGVCRYSPFLGWRDVAVADLVGAVVGVPVLVDNDVNTLALAERWFGVGQGVSDFLLVTVGRGVGLGIVTDGSLFRGAAGAAGEFGHTLVDDSDRPCSCGRTGCLEAIVGEAALLEATRDVRRRRRRSQPRTPAELYKLIEKDADVAALVAAAGRTLGRGVANLVNLFAPELVIVSGEGLEAGPTLVDAIADEVGRHVFPGLAGSYRLVAEPLPEGAWARGAASLVLGELFETPTRTQLDLLARVHGGSQA